MKMEVPLWYNSQPQIISLTRKQQKSRPQGLLFWCARLEHSRIFVSSMRNGCACYNLETDMSDKSDPLVILFGSQARVKLLRFFLFNPNKEFTFEEISRRAKLVRRTARTEINALLRAGVIKKKRIYIQLPDSEKKEKADAYTLNNKFTQLDTLQTFLFETAPIDGKTLLKHLRKAGKLDFVVATGAFAREFDRRLDVMLSMKKLDEKKVENAIKSLESELGIEIKFAAFNTNDLLYRVGMYDKLTRDVFDYPHHILIDKIGIQDELHRSSI